MLQHALRAGVRDVLALGGEPGALAQAVQRLAIALDQANRVPTSFPVTIDPLMTTTTTQMRRRSRFPAAHRW